MMATNIVELLPMFTREVNPSGAELFADLGTGDALGYIEDGFWDARLAGMLNGYTVKKGADLTPPETTGRWFAGPSDADLPEHFWVLIVLFAGFRLIRVKILNLAVNFKAVAGPVSYEQEASATTLRAVLDSMARRLDELKTQYSEQYAGVFVYMDGVLQSEYSHLNLVVR